MKHKLEFVKIDDELFIKINDEYVIGFGLLNYRMLKIHLSIKKTLKQALNKYIGQP
jgi:hypothetical protein